jgi:hypothetical protein
VTHGREFFCKAREHLSYVFDSSHYDVACMLKHMVLTHPAGSLRSYKFLMVPQSQAWAAIVFSGTGQEGSDRETYYLSLCKNMCQMLGVCPPQCLQKCLYKKTLIAHGGRRRTTACSWVH